jgi:hypothetical protein
MKAKRKSKAQQQDAVLIERDDSIDRAAIAAAAQAAEPPLPKLERITRHEVNVGDTVCYLAQRDDRWTVTELHGVWLRAMKRIQNPPGEISQCFLTDTMLPFELVRMIPATVQQQQPSASLTRAASSVSVSAQAISVAAGKTKRTEVPRTVTERHLESRSAPGRPNTRHDEVAALLKEADTLDDLWLIAKSNGIPDGSRERCAHLNNGLQRMWIGNWIRKHPDEVAAARVARRKPEPAPKAAKAKGKTKKKR